MDLAPVLVLCFGATLINLPFGYYRMGVRKYSWRWFLAIHLPIPLILAGRLGLGQSWRIVPLMFVFAVLGQIAGGLLRIRLGLGPQPAGQKTGRRDIKSPD